MFAKMVCVLDTFSIWWGKFDFDNLSDTDRKVKQRQIGVSKQFHADHALHWNKLNLICGD